MLALGVVLLLVGASDDSARAQFTTCLKSAFEKGSDQKIASDAFGAFVRSACGTQIAGFRSSVIAYDLKAGWTRKKAEPDADAQIGDYLGEWSDRYRDKGSITAAK